MRAEATPVPIPNTTVKTRAADGTMLETAWESRRLPGIFIHTDTACVCELNGLIAQQVRAHA